ncbi:MAG: hypothetical protein ABIT37_12955 [Luteolibacter sp.]
MKPPLHFTLLLAACAAVSPSFAQDAAMLPPAKDWLIDPSSFKAQVKKEGDSLVLDNGLARRVIARGTTVDLLNLTSGEHMLRALSPEARVTIDGTEFPVGGLAGQKIMNYYKSEWIDSLAPEPGSYAFADWKELPVSERLKWKKRPEWLAKDLPWPPPGKHVVLRFTPPAGPAPALSGKVIYEEKFGGFKAPDKSWSVTASKAHARSSFSNEGKAGEIMALPDTSVFAERAWPEGGASVELTLDAGDDTISNAWGPGLALVAADGSAVNFIIRPNQQVFETPAGVAGKFDRSKPVRLRATLTQGNVVLEAAQNADAYQNIATLPFPKPPAKLRVGKVGRGGMGGDYEGGDINANLIRCHLLELSVRVAEPAVAAKPRTDLPEVFVHYELYDGIPLFSKWLEVRNRGDKTVRVNRFVADELRLNEAEARNGDCHGAGGERERPRLHVETDMAFGGRVYATADNHAVKLEPDPLYQTHINYSYPPPTLLKVAPRNFHKGDSADPAGSEDVLLGPDQDVAAGGTFDSFRVFELLLDSDERERRTLSQRRMYRTIAPWSQENPLMFHKIQSDPKTVREAIDQAAEVGFEMVIMSFSSGFDFESRDRKYWETYKELADYGKSKGVALGGYSLLGSRGAADLTDNTRGVPAMFGKMPCLGTQWGRDYLQNIVDFTKHAGLGVFENDGSYPGDACAATDHPFHHGIEDSQWVMWRAITGQYQALRAQGVYLNIPDWYVLAGANKCMMGYRETNWSLPRAEQEIIERQNMFDGTWTKTQTMGWMFVPLSQYHGGGAAATIEPLKDHLPHYEARFADLLGYGVQACYRGPQLYDTPETKALVTKWVSFYKAHREVLDQGDIIHLRRPNGLDWDGILHVNPQGKEKAMAFLYNPLNEEIEREIRMPLRYSGLSGEAQVSVNSKAPQKIALDAAQTATLKLKIPAQGRIWVLFN